jgi:hypothetical protein
MSQDSAAGRDVEFELAETTAPPDSHSDTVTTSHVDCIEVAIALPAGEDPGQLPPKAPDSYLRRLSGLHSPQNVPETLQAQQVAQQVTLGDQTSEEPGPPSNPVVVHDAGDYEPISFKTLAWISYLSLVVGCLNAVSALVYAIFLSHMSGTVTQISIGIVDHGAEARTGLSTAAYFGIAISYCIGALLNGFLMIAFASSDGKWHHIRLKYPSVSSWKYPHQLLLTVCVSALAAAYGLMDSDLPNFPRYKASRLELKTPAFLAAIMLTSFAAAILNGFLTLNQMLVVRSGHHTGTLHDIFFFLGYTLRARNCRFMWKVKLLACSLISFLIGACIGTLSYNSDFKYLAVIVPLIMLSPMWILGVVLLVVKVWRGSQAPPVDDEIRDDETIASEFHDGYSTAILVSILSQLHLSQFLKKIIDDDRDDDSLITLSKVKPERIASKYGMSIDQAAAFVDLCFVKVSYSGPKSRRTTVDSVGLRSRRGTFESTGVRSRRATEVDDEENSPRLARRMSEIGLDE